MFIYAVLEVHISK